MSNIAVNIASNIIPGSTPISPSTDKCILFDKAGVVGEDTNFEWDYTSHILNLGSAGRLNATSTWRFDIAGSNELDFGVTHASNWSVGSHLYLVNGATTNLFLSNTPTSLSTGMFLNNAGPTYFGYMGQASSGSGTWNVLGRAGSIGTGTGQFFVSCETGIVSIGAFPSAALYAYNSVDSVIAPTNYERATFDWTTTTNVLTIGTQKGGSGASRNIQFVSGGTAIADFGVTTGGFWTFDTGFVSQGSTAQISVRGNSGNFPGAFIGLTGDAHTRVNFFLNASDLPLITMNTGAAADDIGLGRNGVGIFEVNSGTYGTLRDITLRDLYTNNASFLIRTKTTLNNGAGTGSGVTFTNAPGASGATGNPTKWVPVDDNGTTRYIPMF